MRRNSSIALALGFAMPALLVWGCGGDDGGDGGTDPPPAATAIAAVSGSGQTAQAGSQLPDPFVVRVTDAQGAGVSGVTVSWSVTGGGGSLSAASSQSNSQGQASVTLTLGPAAGQNTVTASASGLTGSPVTFSATATAPPTASAIALVSGDNQNGKTLAALGSPFIVKVTDDQGAGVAGVAVNWAVASGDGSLSASSTTTNGSGEASVTFTSGMTTGASTVTASAAGLTGSPVTFNARTSVLVIEMSGIAFVYPDGSTNSDATVAVGDTIEWVNLDGVQHTATSNIEPAGGAAFDSGLMTTGQTFRFAPAVVGTWEYFCEVHPTIMLGATITVQ
jgi:plastocyanin